MKNTIIVLIITAVVILGFVGFKLISNFTPQAPEQSEQPSQSSEFDTSTENNSTPTESITNQTKKNNMEGLNIEIIKQGTGVMAKNGDKVTVHYLGTFESGVKFDSSIDRGTPFSFNLGAGQVIQGWDNGVLGMKVGEKRKLTISPNLAYGPNGMPGAIPPNATLIFEVELLEIGQ